MGERVNAIADLLSISRDSAERWSKDARQLEKQQDRVWDCWLNCDSEREIEAKIGVAQRTVRDWLGERITANADFRSPPVYRRHFDVWQFPQADGESSYFGRMLPQVVASSPCWDPGKQSFEELYAAWAKIVKTCAGHIEPEGRIAYMIRSTQLDDGSDVHHAMTCCGRAWMLPERRRASHSGWQGHPCHPR